MTPPEAKTIPFETEIHEESVYNPLISSLEEIGVDSIAITTTLDTFLGEDGPESFTKDRLLQFKEYFVVTGAYERLDDRLQQRVKNLITNMYNHH